MAVKNRAEAIVQVNTKIVPRVTNTIHKSLLNDDILNSINFRKDVIITATPAGGNVTANFTSSDLVTVTTSDNLTVSFSGLENGDVKYLKVTKPLNKSVSFYGATDLTPDPIAINKNNTTVIYNVVQKDGVVYVLALQNSLIKGSFSDIENEDYYKYASCGAVYSYFANAPFVDNTAWISATILNGSGTIYYRKTRLNYLEIYIESFLPVGFETIAFTLPSGYIPTNTIKQNTLIINETDIYIIGSNSITNAGKFIFAQYLSNSAINNYFFSIPLNLPTP